MQFFDMEICFKHKIHYDWVSLCLSSKKYVSQKSIVLEIGASNIQRTKQLSALCYKLIGVELYPERTPKDFGNVSYVIGDWQNLSQFIPEENIDVAVASHVIEHLHDDLKAINELYVVLKVGGSHN